MGDHVHDGVVHAGSHVEGLECASLEPDGEVDGADYVGHVGEVTTLAPVSQNLDWLVLLDGPLEGFKREVAALAGSPDREEPQGADLETVLAGVEAAPVFGVEFGQSVGAARVGGTVLGEGQWRVRAVNAGGGGEDEGGDVHAAAEVQQAERADHVGHLVVELAVDGGAHAGKGCQMDHGIEAEVGEHALADVALLEPNALGKRLLGRHVVQGGDPVPCFVKVADGVGADESG